MRVPAVLAFLLPVLAGQNVVYPGGSSASSGGGLNTIPFSSSILSEVRYQLHVPAAALPSSPSTLIDVAFAPGSTGTTTASTLVLSIGHGAPGAPTCNLAGNSNDLTVQHNGPFTYGFTANTWSSLGIPLAFSYNGTDDLLIELRMQGVGGGAAFQSRDSGTNVQRVYNRLAGGFNATMCSHGPSLGLKPCLTFVPQPCLLSITDGGGGGGTVTLQNVPSTTVEGATLVSFDTTGPVGGGPLFGIAPDQTTLGIVLLPGPAPGNPLRWTWPVPPSVWPATPFAIPTGTFMLGTTFDAVAVKLDASGVLTSGNVVRASFN